MTSYLPRHYSSLVPISLSAVPAVFATALLFLLMHSLIANDVPEIDEKVTRIPDLIIPRPEPPEVRRTPLVKPVEVSPPPRWTPPPTITNVAEEELASVITPPPANVGRKVGLMVGGIVAYLKPQPIYPSRPLSRGIEGYVDLAFDVTASGSTANIRVIDAQPPGVFERAAISALQKWKYKVPAVDGVPQGQVDMMTRMSFELED